MRTLASSLVAALAAFTLAIPSTATAVPVVSGTVPGNQAVGVPLNQTVRITFATRLASGTVTPANIVVTSSLQGTHAGSVTWLAPTREILFDPVEDFLPGEQVVVTVGQGIQDQLGIPLSGGYSFSFSTWTAPVADRAFTTSASSWGIGSIAFNVTVADLTGDNRPEAIFSNVVPDSLTIRSPNGLGGFPLLAQLPTSLLPRGVAVGDLDEDGWPDLIISASGPNEVGVIRNLGGTDFAPYEAYPTGQTPYGAWVGDLNADGHLDVATANFNGHSVSVLLGDGTGGLGAYVDYSAGVGSDSPRWVDGSDLDGDGDLDLVCCNGYSYDVSVFLNDGNGILTVQPTRYPVGDSPQLIGLRDFDGDGIGDVVTVNSVGESVSFLKGNGDATFQPRTDTDVMGQFPHGLQIVDLDGDADLDLAVPVRGDNGWRALWNDGSGSFDLGDLYLGGNHCHTLGAADFDLDGDIDILAGYAITKDMYFYAQVVAPHIVGTAPAHNATGVAVSDDIEIWFDDDLAPLSLVPEGFIVEGSQSGPRTAMLEWFGADQRVRITPDAPFLPGEVVRVTVNGNGTVSSQGGVASGGYTFEFMTRGANAAGTFVSAPPIALPGSDPVDLVAADLDGDGVSDLAVANFLSGDVTLLLTGGNGLPTVGPTITTGGGGPAALWAGDLTGDGQVDLVVANVISSNVSILQNQGGTWVAGPPLPVVGAPFALTGADFDQDGDVDIAIAEIDPDFVRVCWNDGAGAFPTSAVIPMNGSPLDLAVADFDRDGDLDIVAVDSANHQMDVILFNSMAGTFSLCAAYSTGFTPISVFPWDTNGDGWIDLVSANYAAGGISVLQNLGAAVTPMPSFAPAFDLPANDLPHGIWGADLTGDDQLELVTANSGGSDVSVFRNLGGGAFDLASSVPAGTTPYSVVGGDWNGDGSVDLAVVNRTSGDLNLLMNGGSTGVPDTVVPTPLVGLQRVTPNPFRDHLSLELAIARRTEVTLRVFDIRGRSVATVHDGPLESGVHTVQWSGHDGSGRPVGTGVYFLRMDAGGRSWTQKVLRVR
ncbi:MAG: hypothetical protein DHS20C21_00820 [Gemmatimonadota bacterium]|nr:MAG: hypothetical protein DHS20C21_00820 [Gemmatimonadota bacterium]